MATAEVCRRHGISSATFYKWKSKFGGLDVSEARRLRSLEEENSRLKKLPAETMLDSGTTSLPASRFRTASSRVQRAPQRRMPPRHKIMRPCYSITRPFASPFR